MIMKRLESLFDMRKKRKGILSFVLIVLTIGIMGLCISCDQNKMPASTPATVDSTTPTTSSATTAAPTTAESIAATALNIRSLTLAEESEYRFRIYLDHTYKEIDLETLRIDEQKNDRQKIKISGTVISIHQFAESGFLFDQYNLRIDNDLNTEWEVLRGIISKYDHLDISIGDNITVWGEFLARSKEEPYLNPLIFANQRIRSDYIYITGEGLLGSRYN